MKLTDRQKEISKIVEKNGPITGQAIAMKLNVTRAALRSDLAILSMIGVIDARPKVGYYFMGFDRLNPVADAVESYIVKDYMSAPIIVSSHTTVYDATIMMFMEDIGTLLVADDEYLIGIISRKDLLRAVIGDGNGRDLPLTMVMTPVSKIIYAETKETVLAVAQRLIDYEVDCLPVVEVEVTEGKRKLRIKGRISKTNITRLFVESGQRFPVRQEL